MILLGLIGPYSVWVRAGSVKLSALLSLAPIMFLLIFAVSSRLIINKKVFVTMIMPFAFVVSIFTFWDLYHISQGTYRKDNTAVVFFCILLTMIMASIKTLSIPHHKLNEALNFSSYIYIIILFLSSLMFAQNPAYSLVSLIFFTHHLLQFYFRGSLLSLGMTFLFIIITYMIESRIVTIVQLLSIIFIYFWYQRSLKFKFLTLTVSAVLIMASLRFGLLNDYLGGGDSALSILGVQINTAGRLYSWSLIVSDLQKNLIFGTGYIIPDDLVGVKRWTQPHNDYLRIALKGGLVSLLLIIFTLFMLWRSSLGIIENSVKLRCQVLFYNLVIVMCTDNIMVYGYAIYPLVFVLFHELKNR